MDKVKQYTILVNGDSNALSSEVTTMLSRGYKLYGDPFTRNTSGGTAQICQAMILIESEGATRAGTQKFV